MKKHYILIIFIGIILFPDSLYSQIKANEKKITSLERQLYSIFMDSNPGDFLKDSVAIYAINFKVDIVKQDRNKTIVTKITANDSIGYKLFPNYKKLLEINYLELLGADKNATLIIPILIYDATYGKIKYRDNHSKPLISMQAAINVAYSLYSTIPYNNIQESEEYLMFRIKDKYLTEKTFTRQIVARPVICDITKIK